MKKVYYHKLIRDGIVKEMERRGKAFAVKKLSQKNFETALITKIEEEAGGVVKARNRQELMEELADVVAVIDAIKKVKKIGPAEFRSVQKANMKRKGGFAKRLWLFWSEDDGYKTNEKRGKK